MGQKTTKNITVKPFQFGQLVPSENTHGSDPQNFQFETLDAAADFKQNISEDVIRSEREHADRTGFEVLPTVKEYRGLKEQEIQDYEQRVEQEVQKRFAAVKEQAYADGLAQGRAEGQAQAHQEVIEQAQGQIEQMAQNIAELNEKRQAIYDQNRDEAYQMVKNLTKWVILKEVDEKYYLVRLLEKLIHEINTKSNLVIRVNQASFGHMPEVVKIVERTLGKLTNVRVEIDQDQNNNGIILESENTIVDGSLDAQMNSIDRLFESVGLHD